MNIINRMGHPSRGYDCELIYRRGSATVRLQAKMRMRRDTFENVRDDWFPVIRRTLDILPESHVAVMGCQPDSHIRIWHRPVSGGGAEPRDPSSQEKPHIWISYAAMEQTYNRTLSFTLLHEMGHQIDWWRKNHEEYDGQPIIRDIYDTDPLGCYCMLLRRHTSRTNTSSEHFADCYADYWYHFLGGIRYQHAISAEFCERSSCKGFYNALRHRISRIPAPIPTDRREIAHRRIEALFRTVPFRNVPSVTMDQLVITGNPAIDPHAGAVDPNQGPRDRRQLDTDDP